MKEEHLKQLRKDLTICPDSVKTEIKYIITNRRGSS